jgi:hypothetical protein
MRKGVIKKYIKLYKYINKMIYLKTIKKLYYIYFTSFPYNLYNYSNRISNFELVGVSNKLIDAQNTFWLANISSMIFIYNIKNFRIGYFYFV